MRAPVLASSWRAIGRHPSLARVRLVSRSLARTEVWPTPRSAHKMCGPGLTASTARNAVLGFLHHACRHSANEPKEVAMSTESQQYGVSGTSVTWSGQPPQPQRVQPTKVSEGERLLYGDFAPLVRDFGNAVAAVHQAHRTLSEYVLEAKAMPPVTSDSEPGWPAGERAFGLAASVLDTVAEAQRELVREALHEVERQRVQFDGCVRSEPLPPRS